MATQTTVLAGMAPELKTFYDRNLLERQRRGREGQRVEATEVHGLPLTSTR